MGAQFLQETDIIEVESLCVLFYGQPGCWKTSLAQTADKPLTLDFDKGLHRCFNRKGGFRFERWADLGDSLVQAQIVKHQTIVVDTIGRALDLLALEIMGGNPAKQLSIQQWGTLKGRFAQWLNQLRLAGKDVVFIAHEKEEREGDSRYFRPDVQGGSYGELMKFLDIVGYLTLDENGNRLLDFNPTNRHMGKNAAGWEPMRVPSLKQEPQFLANLIADAKQKIGNVAQLSAQIAALVAEFSTWMEEDDPNNEEFNARLPELADMPQAAKAQVWGLFQAHAARVQWTFDPKAKRFTLPARVEANGASKEAVA